jgi:hypothetical protein
LNKSGSNWKITAAFAIWSMNGSVWPWSYRGSVSTSAGVLPKRRKTGGITQNPSKLASVKPENEYQ